MLKQWQFSSIFVGEYRIFPSGMCLHSLSLYIVTSYTILCYINNYMGQSPSWEANCSAASQKIRPHPTPFHGTRRFIPTSTNAGHLSLHWARSNQSTPQFYFLNININIILPCTCRCSKWSLSPQVSSPKSCLQLTSPPYVLHATPIPFLLISSTE